MSIVAASPAARARHPGSPEPDLRTALGPLLAAAARRPGGTLVSAVLPVESRDPVALFAAAQSLGEEPSLWLQPGQGFALLGIGSAWTTQAAGATRFAQVARTWANLTEGAVVSSGAAPRASGPLLLGGFGFADAVATTPVWRGFESARFILPSLLLTVTSDGAWLTANRIVEPPTSWGASADQAAESMAASWAQLVAGAEAWALAAQASAAMRPTLRLAARRPDAAEWRASVARLAGAVGRGRLDKVVLARQVDLVAESAIDIPAVLERLRASAVESTVFAVCRAGRTFLGATPERLVSVEGRHLRSVAMAGSVRRAGDPAADDRLAAELLGSDKEREEHAVVVDMLRATLAPLVDDLDIAPVPHVQRLRHVQHLVTLVEGRLREPASVLQLVERLHPTPAVGGMPRDLALELLAEEEGHERGWYAGPLGWADRTGDGEFVVALRSGVVEGRGATLLAGCGIVADSDPQREWEESTTKLLALGSALGRVEA